MAVFRMVSTFLNGMQQTAELKQQGRAYDAQAQLAESSADTVSSQYSAREEAMRRQARQAIGAQRAAIAQSGTGFSGSNLQVLDQSTTNQELDALNLRYQGQLERKSLLSEAITDRLNGKLSRTSAKINTTMTAINTIGAGFGTASPGSLDGAASKFKAWLAPTASAGAYGQGAIGNFGNNVSGFTGYGKGL